MTAIFKYKKIARLTPVDGLENQNISSTNNQFSICGMPPCIIYYPYPKSAEFSKDSGFMV